MIMKTTLMALLTFMLTLVQGATAYAQVKDTVRLPEYSNVAPAAQWFNGLLYIAWTGTDGRLNVISSSDWQAANFPSSRKRTLQEYSYSAPALVDSGGFAVFGLDRYG
jgi:hypothetical protein